MPTDDAAARVAQIRERLGRARECADALGPQMHGADVEYLLDALAAAQARIIELKEDNAGLTEARVTALRMRSEKCDQLAAAEAERDQAQAALDSIRTSLERGATVLVNGSDHRGLLEAFDRVLAERDAAERYANGLTTLADAARALLPFEWLPERTVAGKDNLFCPTCGGCPGSAAQNPHTQRPDGHMAGKYLRRGQVVDGGCPAAPLFDAVRALATQQESGATGVDQVATREEVTSYVRAAMTHNLEWHEDPDLELALRNDGALVCVDCKTVIYPEGDGSDGG